MSLDPRDRALETMLRAGAATPQASVECLDAETLAAWADGTLDTPSLARAEAHVSDCGRCQAMMAALVRATDTTHAVADVERERARRWWQLNIRWLVPLAGAATAALLWMVVPRSTPAPPMAADQLASSTAAAQATPAAPEAGAREQAPAAAPPTRAVQPSDADRLARREPAASPTESAGKQASAPDRQLMAKAETPAAAEVEEARASSQEARASSQAVGTMQAPPAPATAGASAESDMARNRSAFAPSGPAIASRDPVVAWRVRADGVVERSTDTGQTWTPTEGQVAAAAVAGASPSRDVCWLVGRAGLVIISTDGRTWRRATPPAADDLVSVIAIDDRQATVRTAAGASYRTADGGATWTP